MSISNDLVWELVKKNSSFLVKRDRAQFSAEKNNVTNLNSYKFSGLANSANVGVNVAADGKTIQLSVNRAGSGRSRKVGKNAFVVPLKRHQRNHSNRAAETIKKVVGKSLYRPDLARFAVGRYHALKKSQKPIKSIAKKPRKGRRAAKSA